MSSLPPAYDPKEIEEKWYAFWEDNDLFKADNSSEKPPFCIVIPPPNVTGVLHMGHALVNTLQDIMIRYKRMCGFEALWIPGTDHAGISTQTVIEKHLIATQNKRRTDFSRPDFLSKVWEWKEEKEIRILQQLQSLGCSCDWSRLRFTMDEKSNHAVRTIFKKLYDDNLIYQGDYLVNWDPATQTALADDEVEYEEMESFLWYFEYPLKDNPKQKITIATTRPETMLGDTAVAVSPKDPRYSNLIGQKLLLPIADREITILSDGFVDPEFGTGAVKITPAHDFNDYQMGLRHNLEMINILTQDGHINENGGSFAGLTIMEARDAIVSKMKHLGLLAKIEPYTHRVGISYRSKAIVEPYLSKQWFVRMSGFKDKLISVVQNREVTLVPEYWEQTYYYWIDNLRDWCISRQLWWGHRIPVWYNKENPEIKICYAGPFDPPEVKENPDLWYQDEDVLDTWFSSALWPFSTLGWPEKTADFEKFFPTGVLITGHDIIFFWVARMILMSEYALGKVPFTKTFLHGLIYGKSYWRQAEDGSATYVPLDEKKKFDEGAPLPAGVLSRWEKMSKSKGNVIDPMAVSANYGTDAMRIALTSAATHARQIDLDYRRFDEFKNFANKLWNGSRFVFQNTEGLIFDSGPDRTLFALEDAWILSRLNTVIQNMNNYIDSFTFDKAAICAYEFFWNDFCAYYLELIKPILFKKEGTPELRENKQKLLIIILDSVIRLLHPIAPFITEELFSIMKKSVQFNHAASDPYSRAAQKALSKIACIVSDYPKVINPADISPLIEAEFDFVKKIIQALRNIRTEMKILPNIAIEILIIGSDSSANYLLLQKNSRLITALVKCSGLIFTNKEEKSGSCKIIEDLKLLIPIPDALAGQEKMRLEKERQKLQKALISLEAKCANQAFLENAPEEIRKKSFSQLSDLQNQLREIEDKLKLF